MDLEPYLNKTPAVPATLTFLCLFWRRTCENELWRYNNRSIGPTYTVIRTGDVAVTVQCYWRRVHTISAAVTRIAGLFILGCCAGFFVSFCVRVCMYRYCYSACRVGSVCERRFLLNTANDIVDGLGCLTCLPLSGPRVLHDDHDEQVVQAVSGRCEVYLDGGICRGTDVFKALALGAKAVFIGRPVLWGLAHSVSFVCFVCLIFFIGGEL